MRTKPVNTRPLAFKTVCLSVQISIYDDQHKVCCPSRIHTRRTNRGTCPSSSVKMTNVGIFPKTSRPMFELRAFITTFVTLYCNTRAKNNKQTAVMNITDKRIYLTTGHHLRRPVRKNQTTSKFRGKS